MIQRDPGWNARNSGIDAIVFASPKETQMHRLLNAIGLLVGWDVTLVKGSHVTGSWAREKLGQREVPESPEPPIQHGRHGISASGPR